MHNAHMIVALGVYMAVLFVGMGIGMGVATKGRHQDRDAANRRYVAAGVGAGVGVAACVAYAVAMRGAERTATYWASLSILLFGLWTAVYLVVPKVYPKQPTPPTEGMKTAMVTTSSVALGAAVLAYAAAWKWMKPL